MFYMESGVVEIIFNFTIKILLGPKLKLEESWQKFVVGYLK